jgi:RNA polymerase sigma factor (sigma-70 family)
MVVLSSEVVVAGMSKPGAISRMASWIADLHPPVTRPGGAGRDFSSARAGRGIVIGRVPISAAKPLGADELAQHAAFLTRLARALAGRDEAEDLVQDAFVAALRHPPDADRPARPWFAQVLRNLVRMRRRGESRRRERETAWQEDGRVVPSPDQLLDRALAHRALAEQVVLLDEPYRRTVLLRFVEGLETARIAELEGIAPATVRWRLKEGLERMRVGLDGSAGGRARWMRAIAPAPLTAGLGRVDLLSGGALVMKAKSVVALGLLALLAAAGAVVAVMARGGDESPDTAAVAARPPQAAGPARAAGAEPPAPPPRPAGETRPLALVAARAELDPEAVRGSIEGRVVNWSTAAPVPGAEVLLLLDDGASTTIATDAEGHFRFEPDRAGPVSIAAITRPGFLPFAPEWGHSPIVLMARPGVRVRDVVIYLSPAIDYVGQVLAPDGSPVPGAEVRIIDLPAREQEMVSIPDRFTADRRGEFRFHAPDFALLEARARGHGPGRARLNQSAMVTHRMTLRLVPPGTDADALGLSRVTGTVVDAGGEPLPGVVVTAARSEARQRRTAARSSNYDPDLATAGRALSGADGSFTIEGLDPGGYKVEARDSDRKPARAVVTLAPRGSEQVRLSMTQGALVAGTVRDASGQPVAAFTVVVFEGDGLGRGEVAGTRTFIDRDGAFQVEGLEARDYLVQATAHGYAPSRPVAAGAVEPPARPGAVSIQLPAGGTLSGTVRSKTGEALENARVTVEGGVGESATPVPFSASAVTDAQGQFSLRGLAPGRRSVVVGAYGHHAAVVGGLEVVDGARLGPVDVSLTPLREGETPTIELAGIGTALGAGGDALRIDQVIPGGGAEAAGLVVSDEIVSIDGKSVVEIGFEAAIQSIRGPVGTRVRLGVRRASRPDAVVEIAVERRQIRY